MNKIIIVLPISKQKYFVFYEIVECLIYSLNINKLEYELHFLNNNIINKYNDEDLYFMYAAEDFINLPKKCIIMQFEQLKARIHHNPDVKNSEELEEYIFNIFKKGNYVFDYSYENSKILMKNNINVVTVPYGYSPTLSLNSNNFLPVEKRNIDVLWYGNYCERRESILNSIKKVNLVKNQSNLWDNKLKEIGEVSFEKTNTVQKAKIVLNIKYDDPNYSIIETPRIIHAMSNKCLVISEYGYDSQLNNELKEHVIFCHHSQMEDICLFYLQNLDLLQEKVNESYNWLINNYQYSDKLPINIIKKLI